MASKIFIVDQDYSRVIKDAIRDEVISDNPELLRANERPAIEEMMSYLNVRFDISNLFPALDLWHSADLYFPGDYRDYQGTFYRAIRPTDTDPVPNRGIIPTSTGSSPTISPTGNIGEGYYWTDKTFPNIQTWTADENPVEVGQYRERNGSFYRCAVEHNNEDPATAENIYDPVEETGYWIKDDPRKAKLVEICCELALYKAHARIAPKNIPQLRIDHHDMAIQWLKGTATGDNSPIMPRVAAEEENSNAVQFGSIKKRKYTF